MRRAAFGLAVVARADAAGGAGGAWRCSSERGQRRRRPVGRRRAAAPRRRGDAVPLSPERAHAQAWPHCVGRWAGWSGRARRRPPRGPREPRRGRDRRPLRSRALRPAAAELVGAAEHAGVPVLAVDSPSGVDPTSASSTGRGDRRRDRHFGALNPVHVSAAYRCGPGTWSTSDSARVAGAVRTRPGRCRRGGRWPVPVPTDESTPRASRGRRRFCDLPWRGRARHGRRACSRPAGWCASLGTAADPVRAAGPRSSPTTSAPLDAPSPGGGPGSVPMTGVAAPSPPCSTAMSRRASTPTA